MDKALITGVLGAFAMGLVSLLIMVFGALGNGGSVEAFYYWMFWAAPFVVFASFIGGFVLFFILGLVEVLLKSGKKTRFVFYSFFPAFVAFVILEIVLRDTAREGFPLSFFLLTALPGFLVALVRIKVFSKAE